LKIKRSTSSPRTMNLLCLQLSAIVSALTNKQKQQNAIQLFVFTHPNGTLRGTYRLSGGRLFFTPFVVVNAVFILLLLTAFFV
jgi:hypothetical protein